MFLAAATLGFFAAAFSDNQTYAINNTDLEDDNQTHMMMNYAQSGRCVYCHNAADTGMFDCNRGYLDQQFYIQHISPRSVGDQMNVYDIRSAKSGRCLTNTVWATAGLPCHRDINGDQSWLLVGQGGGLRLESARFPGHCLTMVSDFSISSYPCGAKGQQWIFDPPFYPDSGHGTTFTDAEGLWHLAASNNGDISKSLTIGMSWTDSTTVESTDQIGLGYSMEIEGEFWGFKTKHNLSATYLKTWRNTVMQSSTSTSSEDARPCATCQICQSVPLAGISCSGSCVARR